MTTKKPTATPSAEISLTGNGAQSDGLLPVEAWMPSFADFVGRARAIHKLRREGGLLGNMAEYGSMLPVLVNDAGVHFYGIGQEPVAPDSEIEGPLVEVEVDLVTKDEIASDEHVAELKAKVAFHHDKAARRREFEKLKREFDAEEIAK